MFLLCGSELPLTGLLLPGSTPTEKKLGSLIVLRRLAVRNLFSRRAIFLRPSSFFFEYTEGILFLPHLNGDTTRLTNTISIGLEGGRTL